MRVISAEASPVTRVTNSIAPIIERYEGFIIDGFGTLHHGSDPALGSSEAMQRLLAQGKQVVVVVNSSRDHEAARTALARRGVMLDEAIPLISSSGLAREILTGQKAQPYEALGQACLAIDRRIEGSIFPRLPYTYVEDPLTADFILLCGIGTEAVDFELQRQVLAIARLRKLPMVCTNPDTLVLESEWLGRGPGSLAKDYEHSGGRVHWIGKPHPVIYLEALERLGLSADKVVAIGDDIDFDILGSKEIGVDTVLVAAGAHYDHFRGASAKIDYLNRLDQLLDADRHRRAPQWLAAAFKV